MKNLANVALLVIASSMLSLFAAKLYTAEVEKKEEKKKTDEEFQKVRNMSKKMLDQKEQLLDQLKKKHEQVLSQQKEKSEQEKEHIKKLSQTAIKKMEEEKGVLQKKHDDFLKNKEKQTSEKIKSYKAEVQKALDTNKKLESMLSQKKDVEVDVNGKKFKLPKQLNEFLAAKEKSAKQELEIAKKKHAEAIEKQKKNPNDKKLQEAVEQTKKDVQQKEQSLAEVAALATTAFVAGGPLAALAVAALMLIGGISNAKDGSGTYHGGPDTNKLEKQSKSTKPKSASTTPSQQLPLNQQPASGNSKQENAKSHKKLAVQNGRLFVDEKDVGSAENAVLKAVGTEKAIFKMTNGKFVIQTGKNCQEIYQEASTWKLGGEQCCNCSK